VSHFGYTRETVMWKRLTWLSPVIHQFPLQIIFKKTCRCGRTLVIQYRNWHNNHCFLSLVRREFNHVRLPHWKRLTWLSPVIRQFPLQIIFKKTWRCRRTHVVQYRNWHNIHRFLSLVRRESNHVRLPHSKRLMWLSPVIHQFPPVVGKAWEFFSSLGSEK
jgi:hypothetical protein